MKTIYVYVMDTMATWEIGYLLQGFSLESQIKGEKNFEVKTVSKDRNPVKTLDGLQLIPDMIIEEMKEEAVGLILPGGVTWNEQNEIIAIAKNYLADGKLLAGICGATFEFGKEGILNDFKHTSNSVFYLKFDENYQGDELYHDILCMTDMNLITASSAGSLEFAKAILKYFKVYSDDNLDLWYDYYKAGNQESLMKLLNY